MGTIELTITADGCNYLKVRDLVDMLERNGWQDVRTRSSHRIYKREAMNEAIAVPGPDRADVATGTLRSILRTAGLNPDGTPRQRGDSQ